MAIRQARLEPLALSVSGHERMFGLDFPGVEKFGRQIVSLTLLAH